VHEVGHVPVPPGLPHLHVLYRTHPRGNGKARPDFYDPVTAWASMLAALEQVPGATVTVVADGGLPPALDEAVGPEHRRVLVRGGRASSSLRRALAVAAALARQEDGHTLFWFSEDDYLYRPEAMRSLCEAAAALPAADYLTLYTPDDSAWHAEHRSQPDQPVPPLPGGPVRVGGGLWQRAAKTTSTFGVRSAALRADRWLLDLGSRVGAPFDMATWHALQGLRPFPWRHLLADLEPAPGVRGLGKVAAKPLMRGALDLATAAARRHRVLVAPTRPLAAHMEVGYLPGSYDWAALARRTRARTAA